MEIVLQSNESNEFRGNVTANKSLNERGVLVNSPSRSVTSPMSVQQRKAVVFNRAVNYAFYGKGRFISYGVSGDGLNFAIVPAGADFIRITIENIDVRNFVAYQIQRTSGIYKDDTSLEYAPESGQKFYRAKVNQKITFLLDDYDYIMSKPFGQRFVMAFIEGGRAIYKGVFHRTNCDINEDDRSISVQPVVDDEYTKLMEGMEREYDLIKLMPETDELLMHKRPLLQYYSIGDNMITCIGADTYWQQSCNAVGDPNELLRTYKFALNSAFREITIEGTMNPDVRGNYIGRYEAGKRTKYWREDGQYYIQSVLLADTTGRLRDMLQIYDKGGTAYYTSVQEGDDPNGQKLYNPANPATAYGQAKMYGVPHDIYCRVLCDVEKVGEHVTYLIAADDMAGDNRNYRRCVGLKVATAEYSQETSTEPTKWGRTDKGTYFAPPYHLGPEEYYPIAQGTWGYYSIWQPKSNYDWIAEAKGTKSYTIKDAIPLWSAIKVLLKKIDPRLKHEGTEEYSKFLYGGKNPLSFDEWRLFITPKSNIRNGEYQTPAQKAPVTLQGIMTMLANTFRCYCYVEDGKFKIEHVEFFRNGGQYIGVSTIGADLTELENTRNGKKWAFATSRYTFEKFNMPERYEFKWMDDVTDYFTGSPIVVRSEYVEKGKKEDVNIGNFTSDVDYILMNPTDISQDGFVIFATKDGDAVEDDRTYYGYVETKGTNGGTLPKMGIRPVFGGRKGVLEVLMEGGTGQVVFYDKGGRVISEQAVISPSTARQNIPVTIPSDAVNMAFKAVGTIDAKVYKVSVNSLQETTINRTLIKGVEYRHQNGYLSIYDLQPKYWVYDMPSYELEINGEEVQAKSIQRMKVQQLTFPYSVKLNPLALVKTHLGTGKIDKISVNLSSSIAKTTLKYDTY